MAQRTPLAKAILGACPQCGQAPLFQGPVRFVSKCKACGLNVESFNVGDGPAAFLILIVGAILTILAVVVDLSTSPPWWVHLIWIPVGLVLTLGGLRVAKAFLVAQEYAHRAKEGRIAR